jgi:hypothetical protein
MSRFKPQSRFPARRTSFAAAFSAPLPFSLAWFEAVANERARDVNLRNHLSGIGIISITSTVAFGMVKCGLSAKRAAAASCDSACTIE